MELTPLTYHRHIFPVSQYALNVALTYSVKVQLARMHYGYIDDHRPKFE